MENKAGKRQKWVLKDPICHAMEFFSDAEDPEGFSAEELYSQL